MITYNEIPSLSQVIIDTVLLPPTLDTNGGMILYQYTAVSDGDFAFDMTVYVNCGGAFSECTTLLTKNGVLQFTNPNYNHRTTQASSEEITHTHKAKLSLLIGDVVYFGGYTSSPSFDALLVNGAMIVLKVG